jgi:hypothetical protein
MQRDSAGRVENRDVESHLLRGAIDAQIAADEMDDDGPAAGVSDRDLSKKERSAGGIDPVIARGGNTGGARRIGAAAEHGGEAAQEGCSGDARSTWT